MNVAGGTVFGTTGWAAGHADAGHRDMRSSGTLLLPAAGTASRVPCPGWPRPDIHQQGR
jgi:hypothetical protein